MSRFVNQWASLWSTLVISEQFLREEGPKYQYLKAFSLDCRLSPGEPSVLCLEHELAHTEWWLGPNRTVPLTSSPLCSGNSCLQRTILPLTGTPALESPPEFSGHHLYSYLLGEEEVQCSQGVAGLAVACAACVGLPRPPAPCFLLDAPPLLLAPPGTRSC